MNHKVYKDRLKMLKQIERFLSSEVDGSYDHAKFTAMKRQIETELKAGREILHVTEAEEAELKKTL